MFTAHSWGRCPAQVTSVGCVFEAIAELAAGNFSTVLAAAEPIERRPEAAIRTLREMTGEGRLILFGHPTLEQLSREMLQFGCDDYIVTPPSAGELQQMLGTPPLRIAGDERPESIEPDAQRRPDRRQRTRVYFRCWKRFPSRSCSSTHCCSIRTMR